MSMPTGNAQFYGQWTDGDSQNGLCAKSLRRERILSAWIPGLLTLKTQGSLPPEAKAMKLNHERVLSSKKCPAYIFEWFYNQQNSQAF